ncbi:DUF2335 domain-containing protein [Nitrosomonas sp.]
MGYEKIVPGAAERILIMAESSMKHQQQYHCLRHQKNRQHEVKFLVF